MLARSAASEKLTLKEIDDAQAKVDKPQRLALFIILLLSRSR